MAQICMQLAHIVFQPGPVPGPIIPSRVAWGCGWLLLHGAALGNLKHGLLPSGQLLQKAAYHNVGQPWRVKPAAIRSIAAE